MIRESAVQPLSKFHRLNIDNTAASLQKNAADHEILNRLFVLYDKVLETISEKEIRQEDIAEFHLFLFVYRSLITASQNLLMCFVPEATVIIRNAVDAAAYANRIREDKRKGLIWIKKEQKFRDEKFEEAFKRRYPAKPEEDSLMYSLKKAYDFCSEFGGHPNFSATIFDTDSSKGTLDLNLPIKDFGLVKTWMNYTIEIFRKILPIFYRSLGPYINWDFDEEFGKFQTLFEKHKTQVKPLLRVGPKP